MRKVKREPKLATDASAKQLHQLNKIANLRDMYVIISLRIEQDTYEPVYTVLKSVKGTINSYEFMGEGETYEEVIDIITSS